jgi:hypothetical protein
MPESMNQAIRENRRGKIRMAEELIFDKVHNSPEVALLRSRMEVYEETYDPLTRLLWFVGYAPEFDVLELGEQAPEYDAVLIYEIIDDPPPPLLTFRRRELSEQE